MTAKMFRNPYRMFLSREGKMTNDTLQSYSSSEMFRIASERDAAIAQRDELLVAAKALIDAVDYTNANCKLNEQIGAVLPVILIAGMKSAIANAEKGGAK